VRSVLDAILIAGSVTVVLCVGMLAGVRWRMRRQLRIRPDLATRAPTAWLLSTSEPARLHRRLRRIAASARLSAAAGGEATATVAALVQDQAVQLEASLVALSRVWRAERQARRDLAARVAELERLTVRLATGATAASAATELGPGTLNGLADLRDRLDALDQARQELSRVERQAGLGSG